MSITQLFLFLSLGCFVVFVPLAILFNALYFFVVLVRLGDKGKVGWDATWNFRQRKYVDLYLLTLTEDESRKWHNVFLRDSIYIMGGLWLIGIISMFISNAAG